MEKYDWRGLAELKAKYVSNVFKALEFNFLIDEASEHFIIDIEAFWVLKIDEDVAIDMLLNSYDWNLDHLIAVSKHLDNYRDIRVFNKQGV